ncbi:MAG: hypothetical protein KF901_12535 [Myxococcales bacterium]|nr:hypothetical protein [Myxococcales bacterium]
MSRPLWTELVLPCERTPDDALLWSVAPLIARLRADALSWHFFWEPDLWLRFRWRDQLAREAGEAVIREAMGELDRPWELRAYDGDAEHFGADLWQAHEEAFRAGAEMALAIALGERDGSLVRHRAFHWHRHVHCFSNQLHGTWAEEARRSLLQARYRARLMARGDGAEAQRESLAALVESVDRALEQVGALADAERAVLDLWRSRGRPDLAVMLHLEPDFHRDPSEEP